MTAAPVDVELLDMWQMGLAAANKSRKTLDVYRTGVEQFMRWCDDNDRPTTLDRRSVEEFTAHLLKTCEPATARARMTALRQFSKWLATEGEIERDELVGMAQPKLDEKIVPELTEDERRRVIDACKGTSFRDRRDEALIRFMMENGARAGEVCAMTVDDIDMKARTAQIVRGKGGLGRVVFFGDETALALTRYLRMRKSHRLVHTDALWLGGGGQSFSYAGLQKVFRDRGKLAGVERLHPHLLRHTAAKRWLDAGGSENGVMQVMGWRNSDMLYRYVKASAATRAIEESRRLNLGKV
jgi:site-specific recombinase XerD